MEDNILEYKKKKYEGHIKAERTNFLFLDDGSMCYDYCRFWTFEDALIDAVRNHGEDLDDMISLIYPERIDHQPVKEKILKEINKILIEIDK